MRACLLSLSVVGLVCGCGDDTVAVFDGMVAADQAMAADLAVTGDQMAVADLVAAADLVTPEDLVPLPASCSDGVKNGTESDTDCGGSCIRCADGQKCALAADCDSNVCANLACAAPTCSDRVKNGSESDVDCGGSCNKCGSGRMCLNGEDCGSRTCANGICVDASCSDGVKNGNEADVDCGGSCAGKCGDGKGCTGPVDCASGVCDAGTKKCTAPTCTDQSKNGMETDVDCGGTCPACGDGRACAAAANCASGVCTMGKCAAPACGDKVKNGSETDIDCGGGCPGCEDGKACGATTDCVSRVCTGGKCAASMCNDEVANGSETDVDCGGTCSACEDGKACKAATDCRSKNCVGGKCAMPTCTDKTKNGSETDVDCGGTCPGCASGQACSVGADCATASCVAGKCGLPATCSTLKAGSPATKDGVYMIDPDGDGGAAPFAAYCDMTTDGGGWTLVLNLDTSDGHVMWWANAAWTDKSTYGDLAKPFQGDHKSPAWTSYTGAKRILIAVHEQGVYRGWKSWVKADGKTMYEHLQGGDNTVIGSGVINSSTAGIWTGERLLRLGTTLYANHCFKSGGGSCVTATGGDPDGDRIGIDEASGRNDFGGGLGNWHDMSYCCSGTYAGRTCHGGSNAFRTVSEAQAGWGSCHADNGMFGSDSFMPPACGSYSTCSGAGWQDKNNYNYDYAIFLGGP